VVYHEITTLFPHRMCHQFFWKSPFSGQIKYVDATRRLFTWFRSEVPQYWNCYYTSLNSSRRIARAGLHIRQTSLSLLSSSVGYGTELVYEEKLQTRNELLWRIMNAPAGIRNIFEGIRKATSSVVKQARLCTDNARGSFEQLRLVCNKTKSLCSW
jgi:hypothetical protein